MVNKLLGYNFSLFLSRFMDTIGLWLSLAGLLFATVTLAYNVFGHKKYENIRSIKGVVASGIIIVAFLGLLILHLSQLYHNEDVFGSNYVYFGQTLNGQANGQGRLFDLDGNIIYQGGFKANAYHGDGKLYTSFDLGGGESIRALRYDGEFENNNYSGDGKLYTVVSYDNGKREMGFYYIGAFEGGMKSGEGVEYRISGPRAGEEYYRGEFFEGEFCGQGILYYDGGGYLRGSWYNGQAYGYGVHVYNENDNEIEYHGLYWDSYRLGNGKLYVNGVLRFDGYFGEYTYLDENENEVVIHEVKTSLGSEFDERGKLEYYGHFENNMRNGHGILYNTDGDVIFEGEFLDGQPVYESEPTESNPEEYID